MNAGNSENSLTDWPRPADFADDKIDYSEIPPLDDSFFESASWRLPSGDEAVILPLEQDVLFWFRAQGADYLRRMGSILKSYKEACESA